jgi:transposase
MNAHKNARLTFARRLEMVQDIIAGRHSRESAARAQAVSVPTVGKWLGRYLVDGEVGLRDRSSRPHRSPRALDPAVAVRIVELRRKRLTMARIGALLGCATATVSRICARAGVGKLSALEPVPVHRYEWATPGALVHFDTKKLGRIEAIGHRITGDRRDRVRGAGWEHLFVAIDDHARIGRTALRSDDHTPAAVSFLRATVRSFRQLGITVQRVMTDNGPAFAPKPSTAPASNWAYAMSIRARTRRAPTAKRSASFNPRCASGRTVLCTATLDNARRCCGTGFTITTGTARIKASAAWHLCSA